MARIRTTALLLALSHAALAAASEPQPATPGETAAAPEPTAPRESAPGPEAEPGGKVTASHIAKVSVGVGIRADRPVIVVGGRF